MSGCSNCKTSEYILNDKSDSQESLTRNGTSKNRDTGSCVSVLSYADATNEKSFIEEKKSDSEVEKRSIYQGTNVRWKGRVSNYTQISGVKFCIIDDKHLETDLNEGCDWFWLSPANLATENDPDMQSDWNGSWIKYMFNVYSGVNPDKIDFEKDIFLVSGELEYVDFGVDYYNRPVPSIVATKIEKIN